jgi:flagellar assembly factor FliW
MTAALAMAPATFPVMHIRSDLLGDIEASDEQLLDFPAGIFGFPECRRFVLLPGARDGTFWLQSAEHSTLAFLLLDPFVFVSGYVVDVPPGDLEELGAPAGSSDVAVLAIVTLPRERGEQPTANLQGPIALNMSARLGRQVVLPDSKWGTREAVRLRGE